MNCANHSDRIAFNFCYSCKAHYCRDCLSVGKTYYYCALPDCQRAFHDDLPLEPIPHLWQHEAFTGSRTSWIVLLVVSFMASIYITLFVGDEKPVDEVFVVFLEIIITPALLVPLLLIVRKKLSGRDVIIFAYSVTILRIIERVGSHL